MGSMKALRQNVYAEPLELEQVPIPEVTPGAAVIKILASPITSYARDVYNGVRKYPYPTPLTVGGMSIGRVHSLGPDSTALKKDQLVIVDIVYRSRDDPTHVYLNAIHEGYTPESKALMSYWRNGPCAEYIAAPLESIFALDEDRLIKHLGYTIDDLLYIPKIFIPWGGLVDIDVRPSETIVIAPATGGFGSAAVRAALAIGANVIAMGRNKTVLAELESIFQTRYPGLFTTVPIVGDVDKEVAAIRTAAAGRPIDAFFDISPPEGAKSTHFKAAILSLRHSGRVSLMGGQREDVPFPYVKVMHWNIQMKGKWMYERIDCNHLIRLVENGNLPLGKKAGVLPARKFKMEDWEKAFEDAFNGDNLGVGAVFAIGEY